MRNTVVCRLVALDDQVAATRRNSEMRTLGSASPFRLTATRRQYGLCETPKPRPDVRVAAGPESSAMASMCEPFDGVPGGAAGFASDRKALPPVIRAGTAAHPGVRPL